MIGRSFTLKLEINAERSIFVEIYPIGRKKGFTTDAKTKTSLYLKRP